jgi:HEAT repeat protein
MADTPRRTLAPDDALPPVEPPSAAFLVQLFLVPAIIVAIIVFVWLSFHWLAQLGNDPEGYVKTLRRNNEGRWQAALNFANDLRDRGPRGQALKADVGLAKELGSILADEVASGRPKAAGYAGEQSQTLCGYLCRALGEFAVPEAAEPLVARAADVSDPRTAQAAVEALAVLADNLGATGREFADPAAVSQVILAAADSQDVALRSRAAYALGVVGGSGAPARLQALLGDVDDNVRFNAAVALARRHDPAAWDVLAEMIALPDVEAAAGDDAAQSQRYKRALVAINGLKAVGLLVDGIRGPPPAAIVGQVAALRKDPVPDVRSAATALAAKIERLSDSSSSPPQEQ